jgi:hypothetical protein
VNIVRVTMAAGEKLQVKVIGKFHHYSQFPEVEGIWLKLNHDDDENDNNDYYFYYHYSSVLIIY